MAYHKVWGMHDPTWQLAFPFVAIIATLLMLLLFQLFLIKSIIRLVRIGSVPFLQRTEKPGGIPIVRNVIWFSILLFMLLLSTSVYIVFRDLPDLVYDLWALKTGYYKVVHGKTSGVSFEKSRPSGNNIVEFDKMVVDRFAIEIKCTYISRGYKIDPRHCLSVKSGSPVAVAVHHVPAGGRAERAIEVWVGTDR